MSLFREAFTLLTECVEETSAESVIYVTESTTIEDVPATPGTTGSQQKSVANVQVMSDARKWIIRVKWLKIDGVEFEPDFGHKIVWVNGDYRETYEVLPDGGQHCFERIVQGLSYRINTKLIKREPV